jgi:hypothetical protein
MAGIFRGSAQSHQHQLSHIHFIRTSKSSLGIFGKFGQDSSISIDSTELHIGRLKPIKWIKPAMEQISFSKAR